MFFLNAAISANTHRQPYSALISLLVRSYRVELRSFAACQGPSSGGAEVAMTRKVVRSNRMASVALRAWANVVTFLNRTAALGMMVCTTLDRACACQSRRAERSEERRVGKECRSRWSP